MTIHTIKKGFDIKIKGWPEPRLEHAPEPLLVGVQPQDFPGIKPKLLIREGDEVQTGQPLFLDRLDRDVKFVSPATGRVTKVLLGERRRLLRVEVTPVASDSFWEPELLQHGRIAASSREEIVAALKQAGLWPLLRQRPLGKIAQSARVPVGIYVNGMDSEPLAADPAFAVAGLGQDLQAGIDLLRSLTEGEVYFTVRGGVARAKELQDLRSVQVHEFVGPHPAGLVGTHISRIRPMKTGEVAWYLKAQEAARIGSWLRTGHYPSHRVVALAGLHAPAQRYFRIREGATLLTLTGGKPLAGDVRIINGTVLSGAAVEPSGFLGFYANTVTVIAEGHSRRELLGWALPQFGKHSASRAVFYGLKPERDYDLDARLNGGRRHMVNIGAWEKVVPLDIFPTFLVRAIQANDLEEAIHLGLLEVTEEDVALCTFVDPCKTEVGDIIRRGLDLYEKEG